MIRRGIVLAFQAHELRDLRTNARMVPLFFIFPLLGLIRFRSLFKKDRKVMQAIVPLPGPLNRLLIWELFMESALLRLVDLPFGVSVVCVAEKPRAAALAEPEREKAA